MQYLCQEVFKPSFLISGEVRDPAGHAKEFACVRESADHEKEKRRKGSHVQTFQRQKEDAVDSFTTKF